MPREWSVLCFGGPLDGRSIRLHGPLPRTFRPAGAAEAGEYELRPYGPSRFGYVWSGAPPWHRYRPPAAPGQEVTDA
jgi:hypothetical protein